MTSYGYDTSGNQVLVRDQVQTLIQSPSPEELEPTAGPLRTESTRFVYDPLNRVVVTSDPASRTTLRKYDSRGLLIELWDRNNTFDALTKLDGTSANQNSEGGGQFTTYNRRVTRYEYDALGRLTKEGWYTSQGQPSVVTDTYYGANNFAYDAADHAVLTYRTTGAGAKFFVTQRTYDEFGRLKQEDEPVGGYLKFGYNALGQVISVSDSYGGGATQVSNYDTAGRLTWRGTTLASGSGLGFSFEYTPQAAPADGRRDLVANVYGYAGGVSTTPSIKYWRIENHYYDNGQLRIRHHYDYAKAGSPSVERVSYKYNAAGLLEEENRINDVRPDLLARQTKYAYDKQGQVKTVTRSDAPDRPETPYSDGLGNAPYRSEGPGGAAGSWTTSGNRVDVSVLSDRADRNRDLPQPDAVSYANYYDGEGNLVFQGALLPDGVSLAKVLPDAWRYDYDHDNHLVSVSVGKWGGLANQAGDPPATYSANVSLLVEYRYDAEGRMVERVEHTSSGDLVTQFVYVGRELYAEINRV